MSSFPALHTDLYQLTMAQGYWKLGMAEQKGVFELFFREAPFGGGYAIACGLYDVINWFEEFHFTDADTAYLSTLKGRDGSPLFDPAFLKALQHLKLTVDIDAIEEGTLVFPKEPLIRVMGPLWQCQLLETLLLNLINFPTLIATKAARVCFCAGEDEVVEFGLRRAQGPNGGLTASRAAYIGGISATSNVLAGQLFGIPVVGTHAHSWVMAFDNEKEAFESYAKVMPNNCIFLVDTYQTIEGVKEAIAVALELKKKGYPLYGIRLDSGDLALLSLQARALLDKAGLQETKIVASSDLDEYKIEALKKKNAQVSIWGVGTRLVTGFDQPALGGVYKLVALQQNGLWKYKYKRSDDEKKQSLPGIHNVMRVAENGLYKEDRIYDIFKEADAPELNKNVELLLKPIFKEGKLIYNRPSFDTSREKVKQSLKKFPKNILSLIPTEQYPVHFPILKEQRGEKS